MTSSYSQACRVAASALPYWPQPLCSTRGQRPVQADRGAFAAAATFFNQWSGNVCICARSPRDAASLQRAYLSGGRPVACVMTSTSSISTAAVANAPEWTLNAAR